MFVANLYATSSLIIAAGLFIAILVANELGYRSGHWWQKNTDEVIKDQTSSITASILGMLALLMGFTFTMAVQRFDARGAALLEESNAIGTAWLRTNLLPASHENEIRTLFRQYVDTRLASANTSLTADAERERLAGQESALLDQIWRSAVAAAEADPRPVTAGLFIQALNEMIDARDKRHASLNRSIPPVVLYLLFSVFILTCGFLGYGSGLAGRRAYIATLLLASVIVAVMFIVIDLDRPRRGMIQVNQTPLIQLQKSLSPEAAIHTFTTNQSQS